MFLSEAPRPTFNTLFQCSIIWGDSASSRSLFEIEDAAYAIPSYAHSIQKHLAINSCCKYFRLAIKLSSNFPTKKHFDVCHNTEHRASNAPLHGKSMPTGWWWCAWCADQVGKTGSPVLRENASEKIGDSSEHVSNGLCSRSSASRIHLVGARFIVGKYKLLNKPQQLYCTYIDEYPATGCLQGTEFYQEQPHFWSISDVPPPVLCFSDENHMA